MTILRLPICRAMLFSFLLSCAESTLPPGPEDPAANLSQLDRFADRVQSDGLKEAWRRAVEPGSIPRSGSIGVRPLLMLTDAEVSTLRSSLKDPEDLRCLQAIHSISLRAQSDSDPRIAGLLNDIVRIRSQAVDSSQAMTEEPDETSRKDEWYSRADVASKLEPLLRNIASIRNQWAWNRSHRSYLSLMEEHRGCDAGTAARLYKQVSLSLASVPKLPRPPWEFESMDPALAVRTAGRFDAARLPERAAQVLSLLGLPANHSSLQVQQPADVSFSGFAFYPVDPPGDVRITLQPGAGIIPHWSAFHEFGHAAMALLTPGNSCKTLRRPFSMAVSEGCAKVAERMFFSPEWLKLQAVPESEISALKKWERQSELMRMRSILADLEFEQAFYRAPEGELLSEFIRIQRSTAGIEVPHDFPSWTLKRHLAFEPLARMDYLLARCAQAAVYHRLRALPGGLLGVEAQQVMKEAVFAGSTGLSFEEWFRRAVGSEPDCTAWLEDYGFIESSGSHESSGRGK